MMLEQAFPDSVDLEVEKRRAVEHEVPGGEETSMPGWGSWGGMGAKPSRRREEELISAAAARAELLTQARGQRYQI